VGFFFFFLLFVVNRNCQVKKEFFYPIYKIRIFGLTQLLPLSYSGSGYSIRLRGPLDIECKNGPQNVRVVFGLGSTHVKRQPHAITHGRRAKFKSQTNPRGSPISDVPTVGVVCLFWLKKRQFHLSEKSKWKK
jgi:hypothetical protein